MKNKGHYWNLLCGVVGLVAASICIAGGYGVWPITINLGSAIINIAYFFSKDLVGKA